MTVTLEHSEDGHNFTPKNSVPEINNKALTTFGTAVLFGYDPGQLPTATHGRFRISCTGGSPLRLRVRVHVTVRDLDLDWIPPPPLKKIKPYHAPPEPDVQQTKDQTKEDQKNDPKGGSSKVHNPGDY